MTDRRDPFRVLDTIEPPDGWERIAASAGDVPRLDAPRRHRSVRRPAIAWVAAVAVTVALAMLLRGAFTPADEQTPAVSPAPSPSSSLEPISFLQLGPAKQMTAIPTVPGGITSMVDAFGSLWVIGQFAEPGVEQLRRLDDAQGHLVTTFDMPVHGGGEWGGSGLTVGDGAVWATSSQGATIYRIDPSGDAVTSFALDGRAVSALAFDESTGGLWAAVANKGFEGWRLQEIDPRTGSVLSSIDVTTPFSGDLLPVAGTVWELRRDLRHGGVSGGTLHQLVPADAPDIPVGGSFALPVVAGDRIWTPVSASSEVMNLANGIAEIDPASGAVIGSWNVGGVGYDIAAGDAGGIWFLSGTHVEWLNPATGNVRSWPATYPDQTPTFVVPTADAVWVGSYEGGLYSHHLAS